MLTYKKKLFAVLALSIVLILGVSTLSATDVSNDTTSTIEDESVKSSDIVSITEQTTDNNIIEEVENKESITSTNESSTTTGNSKTLKSDSNYTGEIYLSTRGAEDSDGSYYSPVYTMATAIKLATREGGSHKIVVMDGTYPVVNQTITTDLEIVGVTGAILTANKQGYIFKVSGGDLTVFNIIFTDGYRGDAGAIHSTGNLYLNRCTFINNNAVIGGAIKTTGNVNITNCTFANNSAVASGSAICLEGEGPSYIVNSTFTNNSATIYGTIWSKSKLIVDGCKFNSNMARSGIDMYLQKSANITNCNFTNSENNRGVLYIGSSGEYNIDNIIIDNATTKMGVLYVSLTSKLNITNSIIRNSNSSYNALFHVYDGVNITLDNVTIEDNIASRLFHIELKSSKINITNSKIINNTLEGVLLENFGTTTIINTEFINNTALNDSVLFDKQANATTISINNTFLGNNLISTMDANISSRYYTRAQNIIPVTIKTDDIYNTTVQTGVVILYENSVEVAQADVIDGVAQVIYSPTSTGTKLLKLKYTDETRSFQNSTVETATINVVKSNTTFTVRVINSTYGNLAINVTLLNRATRDPIDNAPVAITTEDINVTTITGEDGSAVIPLDLPIGGNNILITFADASDYNGINDVVGVYVEKRESSITATVVNNTAGNVELNVIVTDAANGSQIDEGNVIITLNNETIGRGSLSNGQALITTSIENSGEYILNVLFEKSDIYESSNVDLDVIVSMNPETQINAIILNNTIGNTLINLTLTDSEDNTINDATIVVTLPNGDNTVAITGDDGGIVVLLDLPVGENSVVISYAGSDEYLESSTTLDVVVEKIETTISVDSISGVIGEKVNLTAHITGINGEVINSGRVVFKVNGKTLRDNDGNIIYITVKDSQAVITDFVIPTTWTNANYDISAVYGGNSEFESSRSENSTLSIQKRNATLTLDKITAKAGETIKLSVTITDNITSNAVTEGKVVFKLNGKTLRDADGNNIYAVVENGVATIEYTLPSMSAKEYKLTAVFANSIYGRADANSTLTVTK